MYIFLLVMYFYVHKCFVHSTKMPVILSSYTGSIALQSHFKAISCFHNTETQI